MAGPAASTPGLLRRLHARWRSSLTLRVVSTTMVLGVVLTLLLGTLLFQRVADGLVRQAVSNAQVDGVQHVRRVQDSLDALDRRDTASLNDAAIDNVGRIIAGDGQVRAALLGPSLSNDRDVQVLPLSLGGLSADDVPMQLRQVLDDDPGVQQVQVSRVSLVEEPAEPAVFVGARLQIPRAGPHDLVLLYSMQREQDTLDLIRQWFLVGGLGVLGVTGGLAWLVTRMVSDPVGRAARVSQQLAEGRLDERLPVRGTDELDRLATSFNTMADSLESQIRQLESLSQLQQRFVSDVSHELRTPLTTIRMAGEVLHASREDFTAPVARSAELLYEELDRFEELLTELLEISRYDSGAAVLELETEDLHALVEDVLDGLRPLADRAGSELVLRSPGEPVLVEMDRRRVSRVLRNVVGNAVEHGEGRPVEVSLVESEDVVSVSVRDHGVGLDPGQGQQVFERFWRADPARTRSTGGTGLGLAIAAEDARLHGGWLQASGQPGKGACFRLTLPRTGGRVIGEEPGPVPFHPALDAVPPTVRTVPEPEASEPARRDPADPAAAVDPVGVVAGGGREEEP